MWITFIHFCWKRYQNGCLLTMWLAKLRQYPMSFIKSGPCITNVIATCRKNFSQWESSFLWKLRYHWLKFLRRVAKTLVIQGPGFFGTALFRVVSMFSLLYHFPKELWRLSQVLVRTCYKWMALRFANITFLCICFPFYINLYAIVPICLQAESVLANTHLISHFSVILQTRTNWKTLWIIF